MMLGLQGNASPSKEYRCVACSATFTGLASLLVHQATHAGTLSKLPNPAQKQTDANLLETSCPTMSTDHHGSVSHMPESPSSSFYICDCGEEFKDFVLMMEHKQMHDSELLSLQPSDNNDLTSDREDVDLSHTQCESLPAAQTDIVLGSSSTSELYAFTNIAAEVNEEDSAVTSTQSMSTSPRGDAEEPVEKTLAAEMLSEETEGHEAFESVPKNKSLMKILASAYGKRYLSQCTDNMNTVTLKEEPVPVAIPPQPKNQQSVTDMSVLQLRRFLGKPGMKTKAPSISRLLECSTKKIVSLTKIFSPVVVLETRQKFIDIESDGTYGKYQCARCRRVFQDVNGLTEHHFLHKKERIKCCRRCKQLIIGRIPFPDNHICPQLGRKITLYSSSLRKNATTGQKKIQFNSLNNRKMVYFCPICKHNYARRYNLKMHKCRGPVSADTLQVKPLNSTIETDLRGQDEKVFQSIAVGTQVTGCIKVEETSPDSETTFSQLAWASPSIIEQHNSGSVFGTSFLRGQDSWVSMADEDGNEGQWTMPLDDEMEMLPSAEEDPSVNETVHHSQVKAVSLHYFVKDGIKRYPCNKCQQTYSSSCTLRRHQILCGFKAQGIRNVQSSSAISLNANNVKMFACYVCGRNFNRKDNMMAHRKKCELRRTMNPDAVNENNQSLPSNASECQTQEDDGSSWGIMSLPSVLPRRVTCECGIGFTSPRLLLEHLQKHAQESYTCPTCGVTVNSWADYEIHLQIHMHPLHQKQSQPLLLRFKQSTLQQQSSQTVPKLPVKLPPFQEQVPKRKRKKQQRTICSKCGNTFASLCSLRRHISCNRCKGVRLNLPTKTHHCSHCSSDFPNAISLLFHQRSGACKPAIKPVRCPVCLRWFTTTEGLQKHLLAHKHSETFRCDVCQGTYLSLKSLKNHRRRIHRIMAGETNPKSKEQVVHGSVSFMAGETNPKSKEQVVHGSVSFMAGETNPKSKEQVVHGSVSL